jgi:hypothetical protein
LSLHSCDPGVTAKVVTDRSIAAYQLLVFRDQLIGEFVRAGTTTNVATCASDAVSAQASIADLSVGKGPAVLTNLVALRQIVVDCNSPGRDTVPLDQIDQ